MLSTLSKEKRSFNVEEIRKDFPILEQQVNGYPLVYLDNAATTQKPNAVIDAISRYYRTINANVHRGAHSLSDAATQEFEAARSTLANFVNSPAPEQIIWTRGTTEAINLIAHCWGRANLAKGDRILVSELEHHSNIVPWQLVCEEKGARVEPVRVNQNGEIDLEDFHRLLDERVRLVSINHVSNVLGSVNPVKTIIDSAHSVGALCVIDGAQAVSHFPVDVQVLNCDFYCFSAHKLFGPTGIGVLWGRKQLLESMPPYQGGGEMIEQVSFSGTTFNGLPYKFEAGTPDIAGAIGFKAAVDYLSVFDRAELEAHEYSLLQYCIELGRAFESIKRIGTSDTQVGVYSFLLDGCHPADVGTLLDQQGIAVRTGHHCAQPLMKVFSIPGTVRASFSIYNTHAEIDRLFAGLEKARKFLQ